MTLINYRFLVLTTILSLPGFAAQAQADSDDAGMLGIVLAEKVDETAKNKDPKRNMVFARSVLAGSAADQAGIKAEDTILEFNGQPLSTASTLKAMAAKTKPGTKINLSISRNGKNQTLAVIMGSRKEFEQTTSASFTGKPAPALSGTEVKTGKPRQLTEFSGQPVLVELWATWCPTCRANIPRLNAMTDRYKAKKLQIISISNEEKDVLVNFEQKNEIKYLSLQVEETVLHRAYWTNAIPTFIYIDPKGIIKLVTVGDEGLGAIEREISALK